MNRKISKCLALAALLMFAGATFQITGDHYIRGAICFVVLIGVKGSATLTDNEGQTTTLRAGETVLIPANTKEISVKGEIKFLETYV